MVFIKITNILLINHEESEQLTGIKHIPKAAKKLLSLGPKLIVIKMGSKGAYIANQNNNLLIPVYPITSLIDPTGAGDSFAGGFSGYLAQSNNPYFCDAVIFGSALASFCVESFGIDGLLLATPDLLNKRVHKIKQILNQEVVI